MAIDWPNLSQGTNIGYLYTSTNGDVWRWNGYAWDLSSLQYSGSYGGTWVIFDTSYQPNYYSNINLALAAAVPGDTIYLTTDTSETILDSITLKDKVNINLNGNTYNCLIDFTFPPTHYCFIGDNISCNIQNGIIWINGQYGISITNINSNLNLTGLSVKLNGIRCGVFDGSLDGGSFFNTSTDINSAAVELRSGYSSGQTTPRIFRNIKGESSGGYGILIKP